MNEVALPPVEAPRPLDARVGDVDAAGGKARGLARLIGSGLPVPPGFVIPADWYRLQLEAVTGVDVGSEDPGAEDPGSVAARLRSRPLPPAMRAALARALQRTGLAGPFAVRSSGSAEDGRAHSFAGQFDTVLGVADLDALDVAVRAVWASAWSGHALAYVQARAMMPVAMAVVVQQQVDAAWSGVLFTRDPRAHGSSGADADGVLEMVPGLGDALVGGSAEPWRFRIPAQGGAVLESRPVPGDAASAAAEATPDPSRASWITELVDGARRLAAERGEPQDIEWCVDRQGRLWWLQSRPVTAQQPDAARAAPAQAHEWWSNANVAENFPDPLTPFLFSVVRRGYAAYFRNLGLGFGIAPGRVAAMAPRLDRLVGLHGGRLYYNLTNIHAVLALAPFGRHLAAWFNTFTGAKTFPEVPAAPIGRFARWLEPLRIAASTAARYRRIEDHVRRFEGVVDDYAASTTPSALAPADPGAIADRIAAFLEIRTDRWNDAALADAAAMVTYGLLGRLAASPRLSDDPSRLHALLKGLPDLVSAKPVERLWALAHSARADPALAKRIAEDEPAALAAAWRAGALGEFGERFTEYLQRWGFRYSRELMLDCPTPDEDPAPMFALLKTYLRVDGSDPAALAAVQARDREAVTRATEARLTPNPVWRRWPLSRAGRFRRLLAATQASIRYRERARMKQALLYTRLRKVVREAGRLLAAAGWIDAADDAFMMTPEALMDLLRRLAAGDAALAPSRAERAAIATARLFFHAQAAQSPPDLLHLPRDVAWTPGWRMPAGAGQEGAAAGPGDAARAVGEAGTGAGTEAGVETQAGTEMGTETGAAGEPLCGTAACGGRAQGRGIVVADVSGIDAIEPGQVLVTRQTDPGWATVFFLVSGLVIERGGMLSHGAIIAREYGIPAVIGVPQATSRIRSGQWLVVDGDRGTVTADDR